MECKECRKYKGCALERRGICADFEKKEEKEVREWEKRF